MESVELGWGIQDKPADSENMDLLDNTAPLAVDMLAAGTDFADIAVVVQTVAFAELYTEFPVVELSAGMRAADTARIVVAAAVAELEEDTLVAIAEDLDLGTVAVVAVGIAVLVEVDTAAVEDKLVVDTLSPGVAVDTED